MTSPYPVLEILSSALENNLKVIRSQINKPNCRVLIPVKANAYGCGIETILPFLENADVDILGVASPFEASQIRRQGSRKEILLLGSFYKENIDLIFKEEITPTITNLWQIEFLEREAKNRGRNLNVHIKWDTGMGRLGLLPNEKNDLIKLILKTSLLKIKGMMTHFPSGERKSSLIQLKKFLEITEEVIDKLSLNREDVTLHSANSYAILNYPESALDMIRPGLIFYGYFQTFRDYKKMREKFPIQPCMKLTARPFSYRRLNKGDRVSYASLYKVKEDHYPVAVLPIGYGDGIPRLLSNQISFGSLPLLGRVTMDQIVLGGVQESTKTIEILGANSPPLEYWVEKARTISYEIMVSMGERLQRRLI